MYLPKLNYHSINWVEGMKLTKEHFMDTDQATRDAMRDMAGVFLNDFNFGLLPSAMGVGSALKLDFDGSELVLSECRIITPGGVRVDIHEGFISPLRCSIDSMRQDMLNGKHNSFLVVLIADPFERSPVGEPNPEEIPLRIPFTIPSCRLTVTTSEHLAQNPAGVYHVAVGKLKIEAGVIILDASYIPPSVCIGAHPSLIEFYIKNGGRMGEIAGYSMAIVSKVKSNTRPGQINQLAVNIGDLAEKIVMFIGDSLDSYRLIINQMPPIHAVEYYVRFSRVLISTLRCMPEKEKESVYSYFKSWCGISPVEMESHINNVLESVYQHSDVVPTLTSISSFMEFITALLSKLSQLNYVEKEKDEFFIPRDETAVKGKSGIWGF